MYQFSMVDVAGIERVPHVHNLKVVIEVDQYPDVSYLEENFEERLLQYQCGEFVLVGVYCLAQVFIPKGSQDSWQVLTVRSGGLWGIESDSGKDYFKEVAGEQFEDIKETLKLLHIPTETLALPDTFTER